MTLTVTNAGLAASLDAASKGIKLKIKKIGFGSAGYVPDKDQTSLKSEFLRTDFTDSSISSNTLNMNVVFDDLNQVFDAKEVGYYLEDDTLFAVDSLNGAIISSKHKGTILTESFEIVLSDHLIDSITVDVIGVSRATENNIGIAKIATSNEAGDANNDADIVTPKKMLLTLGDRGIAGSGCLDTVSLNSNERGSIVFSDERSSITINSAKYLFSSSVVEIDTAEILLEKLVGNVSRKDFVYVTSEGYLLLSKGTDDSSDPKIAFSKIGFAPVSGDPLLYKKGEVYALAIGFIQRVGDTYFSSKLPPAAPKIEPKLINGWFDLRLSAHKQDVNLLREKAIRSAVAGELRGRSGVTTNIKRDIQCTGSSSAFYVYYNGDTGIVPTVGSIVNGFDEIGDTVFIRIVRTGSAVLHSDYAAWDDGEWHECSVHQHRDGITVLKGVGLGMTWISSGNMGEIIVDSLWFGNASKNRSSAYTLTAEFDTVPCVDIVGTPQNIVTAFPEGVIGQWIPQTLDDTLKPYYFNKKVLSTPHRTYTTDLGATWITGISPVFDSVTNSTGKWLADNNFVYLFQYESLSKFTQLANNSNVVGGVGDVSAIICNDSQFGARLAYSTIDRILQNSNMSAGVHDILSKIKYNIFNNKLVPSNSWGNRSSDMNHSQLSFGTPTPAESHGLKALSTITEKNGLLYLQLHGCELFHNVNGWGDDSIVPIVYGEGTKTDTNGNTVKTFCHHSIFPIGIADSQTLASLKIDNRANISDDINSGLHFDCIEDVPEPIRDFYYEIEDDLGLIRVYKYPHPYESGGHISDESVASWQFHDDFKDWLQVCAEIKFNASQEGEESERVPLPPMPIKSNYIGEKQ